MVTSICMFTWSPIFTKKGKEVPSLQLPPGLGKGFPTKKTMSLIF